MQRTGDLQSRQNPKRDPIVAAAQSGVLEYSELAFWWALLYWEDHHEWPMLKQISPGVRKDFGQRINRSAAYRGLRRARRTQA